MWIYKKIKKLFHLFNEKGALNTIMYLMSYLKNNFLNIYLESYYVFETDLSRFSDIETPKIRAKIYKIENCVSDIKDLVRFWPDYYRFGRSDHELEMSVQYYMRCGDECFCIIVDGAIVGMLWVGYEGNYMLKSIAKKDGLSNNEAIIHRAYVSESARGNKLLAFLSTSIRKSLKDRGFVRTRSYVGINNVATIVTSLKIDDRYHILYHLELHIFGIRLNFFPNYSKSWLPTRRA